MTDTDATLLDPPATTVPVYTASPPDGHRAGRGEAAAEVLALATYEDMTTQSADGELIINHLRVNCATPVDGERFYQCRDSETPADAPMAYVALDRYLVWTPGDPGELEVFAIDGSSVEELATAIADADVDEDAFVGPDYVLFPSMGYGVFPGDNPTSVGRYVDPRHNPGDLAESGRDIRIYVADTGYVATLPAHDFLEKVHQGSEPGDLEVPPPATSNSSTAHGLMVAGIAGQRAPAAEVIVLNVGDTSFMVADPLVPDAWVNVLTISSFWDRMSSVPVNLEHWNVLNMSFGTYDCDSLDFPDLNLNLFGELITRLSEKYVLVAAAGNNSSSVPHYPAAFDAVTGVGAIDDTVPSACTTAPTWGAEGTGCAPAPHVKPWFSNYGEWVSVCAPGSDVVTAYPENVMYHYSEYVNAGGVTEHRAAYKSQPGPLVRISGTSFAAPFAAAQLAEQLAEVFPDIAGQDAVVRQEVIDQVIQDFTANNQCPATP